MEISHIKNKSDIETLAQAYANYYNNSVLEEKWTTETATKMFEFFYNIAPDLFFFVAYDNKKTVGVIMTLLKPWCDGMHLEDGEVFVLPEYRRGGGSQTVV